MDRKRLQYFVILAKKLHFGAAAEELGIAQSALSRQISILEEEMGCMLFDRSNRWNVSLTAAGSSFFIEVQKILTQFDNAQKLASSIARGEAGNLLIAVVPAAVNVPGFLNALRKMQVFYHKLHLNIKTANSKVIYDKVRNKETDLGIVRMAPVHTEDLQMAILENDNLLAAIPKKHPLAKKEHLFLSDFRNERIIFQESQDATPLRSMLDIMCRNAGFTPNVVMEIENITVLLHLLPVLNCVTILPKSFPRHYNDLVYRPFEDCNEHLPISAVWRTDNNSPTLKKFLHILMQK
ncbi:MAG: LysR family transcriptional regulator [Lentisphaeria bacterium]|nr:LysR family transcriptional regulator [Lentisphaeria bacterium]